MHSDACMQTIAAGAAHLCNIVGCQPLQGVVEERHANQGQQHLGPLKCDGSEALRGTAAQDQGIARHDLL